MEFLTDPYSWWIEPFVSSDYRFMRTALYAGLLVALTTSVTGVWVVLRGLSFLGDALAHGILPGVAVAFIIGIEPSIGAIVAAGVMVGGISAIRAKSPLSDDTSIGVLFVGFLALAVVMLSASSATYVSDLNRFLFGPSVAGVDTGDIAVQLGAAIVAVIGVIIGYRSFLVMTFDEALAETLGLKPRLANWAMLMLVAVAIIASFQVVGNLLVFAFLIAPPAAATLLARRIPVVIVLSVLLGSIAVIVGLLISLHYATATGATMALVSVLLFLVALVASNLRPAA